MADEKKGITVKIGAALHAEIREYLERHEGMTMAEFITLAVDDELHPKKQQGVREKASPFGLTFLCCSLHVGKRLHGLGEALEGLVGVTVFNAIADAVLNVSLRHDLSALFLRSPRHRRAQPGKILVKRHQQLEIPQNLLRQLRPLRPRPDHGHLALQNID